MVTKRPSIALLLLALSLSASPLLALPDAVISSLDAQGADFYEGDRVEISVTIANRGDSDLPSIPIDLTIDDASYAEWHTPSPLAPGATAVRSLTWPAFSGSHVIRATADPLNDIAELNEANNSGFINLGVGFAPEPSPWPAALTGLAAFLMGGLLAFLIQRRRRSGRPPQSSYAVRRPPSTAGRSPSRPGLPAPPSSSPKSGGAA